MWVIPRIQFPGAAQISGIFRAVLGKNQTHRPAGDGVQYSASVPVTQLLPEAPHSTGQSSLLLPLLAESLSLEDAGNPCQDSEALNMLTWRQGLPSSESRRREIKPHFVPVIIVFSQKTASPALPMKVALFIIQQHQLWGHCGSLVGSLLSQALC